MARSVTKQIPESSTRGDTTRGPWEHPHPRKKYELGGDGERVLPR